VIYPGDAQRAAIAAMSGVFRAVLQAGDSVAVAASLAPARVRDDAVRTAILMDAEARWAAAGVAAGTGR
jgi:hypothetical protein